MDYSFSRPAPTCLKQSGKLFAVRYLGRDPRGGKDLTKTEADRLKAAGLARLVVYQPRRSFVPSLGDDGRAAARQAHLDASACGMPAARPIYFSIDGDTRAFTTVQWAQVDRFFGEVISVLGVDSVGVYGGKNTVERMRARHLAHWYWQTYAWSGGEWADVHLRQYDNGNPLCGGEVDLDRAMTRDYGQW